MIRNARIESATPKYHYTDRKQFSMSAGSELFAPYLTEIRYDDGSDTCRKGLRDGCC